MVQKQDMCYLLIVRQARGPLRPFLHRFLRNQCESRNDHGGDHPRLVLYNLLSHQSQTCPSLDLHPLKIPPTNLVEVSGVIRTSNHTAELSEKYCGMVHGATEVMKDQVLMDPAVGQLEPASLQSGL